MRAKKITTITPAQSARFGEWADMWINIGLSTEPAEFDAATDAALKAYALCNLDRPKIILRMSSPYGACVGGTVAWAILREMSQVGAKVESQVMSEVWSHVQSEVESQVRSQVQLRVGEQVWSQVQLRVGEQVWSQVGEKVRSQVREQVESQVGEQVESQVGEQVWWQVWSQVGETVRSQVREQVQSAVGAKVGSQVRLVSNSRGGSFWASWCAYISFLRDVVGWRGSTLDRFEIEEAIIKSCGWVWWHEDVLAISDRPSIIKRDNAGRLHCDDGPAIAYRDGWAVYSWHGVAVPSEWIENKSSLTPAVALTWSNIEQRRAACEMVGWHRIVDELGGVTISKHKNPQIGSLVEVTIPEIGKERFLRVKCGTGRDFAIPVPPDMETALQANAWTYGFDDHKQFSIPEVRT